MFLLGSRWMREEVNGCSQLMDDAFGVAELVAAGDHDAVAGLQAVEDLDRADAAGAERIGRRTAVSPSIT